MKGYVKGGLYPNVKKSASKTSQSNADQNKFAFTGFKLIFKMP